MAAPDHLRCEYLENPVGIDTRQPRLSWFVRDSRRGAQQSAYRLMVSCSSELLSADIADVWDSGMVMSDESAHIEYCGCPLQSDTSYFWKVRCWDADGAPSGWSEDAYWSMGLLNRDDWQGRWISDPSEPPAPLPAHNGYMSLPSLDQYESKWVTVDLGAVKPFDTLMLYGARPFDRIPPDSPGYLFPVRYRIEVSNEPHFVDARVIADHSSADVPNPGAQARIERVGTVTARYVRLVVTQLAAYDDDRYAFALSEMEICYAGTNLALGADVTAADSLEDSCWSIHKLLDGDKFWHPGGDVAPMPQPMLRKEFQVDGPIRRATVYTTALGLYELLVNGSKVGDHCLAPEWTDYTKKVQYQSFDITELLDSGKNALAVMLGDGWYAGRVGMTQVLRGQLRGVYGRKPKFLLQLHVEMEDGSKMVVVSDGSWRSSMDGPIRTSDILNGEYYDARQEMPGWDRTGFDDTDWNSVTVDNTSNINLVAQMCEPIKVIRQLDSMRSHSADDGVLLMDIRQNIAGWVRVKLKGAAGTVVTFRHGQMLSSDGRLYCTSLRGAPQTDVYVLSGDPDGELYEPRFTYHGFRYIEITGLASPEDLLSLVGCAISSSAPSAGRFECSDPMLNKIMDAVVWTQWSNLISVPTDCCERDERLPWIIDFTQTELFHMGMAPFLTKYLQEIAEDQQDDGRLPDMAPNILRNYGTPGVSDSSINVAWSLYTNYGDIRILELMFEPARRWTDFVLRHNPDFIWRNQTAGNFGDWLNGDFMVMDGWPITGANIPKDLLNTVFLARDVEIVAKMAAVLGRDDASAHYHGLLTATKRAFTEQFVGDDGRIYGDTQAGYAMALNLNMVPGPLIQPAIEHLLAAISDRQNRLSTGNHSSHRMIMELSRYGYHQLAYQLVTDSRCPSWGYMVENGATSIWERWDGYLAEKRGNELALRFQAICDADTYVNTDGFQDPGMNSYNHRGYVGVSEWMVHDVLGLSHDETAPGYKRFTVNPRGGPDITWAKACYQSIHGDIAVSWSRDAGAFRLEVCVPPGCTAEVHVPSDQVESVTESGSSASAAEGVSLLRVEDKSAVFQVLSGRYQFRADMGQQSW